MGDFNEIKKKLIEENDKNYGAEIKEEYGEEVEYELAPHSLSYNFRNMTTRKLLASSNWNHLTLAIQFQLHISAADSKRKTA